jgi:hypothetical protein
MVDHEDCTLSLIGKVLGSQRHTQKSSDFEYSMKQKGSNNSREYTHRVVPRLYHPEATTSRPVIRV